MRGPEAQRAEAPPDHAEALALLTGAALAAAPLAMAHFGRAPAVTEKPDGQGPVSEADLAVDAFLRERLLAARPDAGWLSEETPDTPERLAREAVFVVDPIDGTRAYLKGETAWALSLALVVGGAPVAACVHMPAKGRTYAALLGGGARRDGAPIRCSDRGEAAGARVLTTKSSLAPAHWPRGAPAVSRHFRASLAYRLCLVAEGRYDAMLTLRPAWAWDVAAGALIAAEAGAAVSDAAGRPLDLAAPDPRSPGCVAAAPGIHAALLP